MKRKDIICILGLSVLTAASCTSDESLYSDVRHSGMSFDVAVVQLQEQQGNSFRAPAITNTPMKGKGTQMYVRQTTVGAIDQHVERDLKTRGTKVEAIDNFKLYSYKYSGTWDSNNSSATVVSDGETLKSAESWTSAKPWAAGNMAFFGIYDATGDATFTNNNGGELTYTVPDAVADQKDLLVAKNVDITEAASNSNVSMAFSHALTAVQFGIGSTMADGTITKIELQGIKNSGTYSFKDGIWTAGDDTKSYSIPLNVAISSNKGTGTATNLITGNNDDLLLLMPQTLGSEAKLVVSITENGTPQTLSVSLAGGVWKAGHTVTYSLSTQSESGQYVFIVGDVNNATLDENGGIVSATIKSYYQDYYGTQTQIGWTATYSVDGGAETSTEGDVVSSFTANGTGSSDYSMTVEKSYPISDPSLNSHTQTLRDAAIQGTESNPINLAGTDGSETTANCYIVSAPGYYKLPLVYGNGLKNGSKNTASIVDKKPFVNHLGNVISNPYLYINTGVNPNNAVIVWQDAYHLVLPSSVTLSSDNKYLIFQVPQEYICQGNCVLAVRDESNTILWSWHIWVTDQDMTTVSSTYGTDTYNFMPVALGHCDADTRKTPSHTIKVNLRQSYNGKTSNKNLTQTASTHTLGVSAPYYQWGRKDPQHPGDMVSQGWKQLYDNADYPEVSTGDGGYNSNPVNLEVAIQNPNVNYAKDNDWSINHYNDLWHVGNIQNNVVYTKSSNPVKKSIYDPCPVGFKIPEPAAFGALSGNWNGTTYAFEFITNNYWYAYGIINSGSLSAVRTYGYCWSAGPYQTGFSCSLHYKTGDVQRSVNHYRMYSFSVRSVSE